MKVLVADDIFLNWKALEPPLVEVAGAGRVAERVPTLGVGMSQTAQEACQLPVPLRPEDEVEMIGHEAVAKNAGWMTFQGVINHTPFHVRAVLSQPPLANRAVRGNREPEDSVGVASEGRRIGALPLGLREAQAFKGNLNQRKRGVAVQLK